MCMRRNGNPMALCWPNASDLCRFVVFAKFDIGRYVVCRVKMFAVV